MKFTTNIPPTIEFLVNTYYSNVDVATEKVLKLFEDIDKGRVQSYLLFTELHKIYEPVVNLRNKLLKDYKCIVKGAKLPSYHGEFFSIN